VSALELAEAGPFKLALAEIKIDPELQCRANGVNNATVKEYAEAMTAGAVFPPCVVFKDKQGTHWLADGFHRCAALASISETSEITVDLREGSRKDALVFGASANASHGLRRTNADKRRAVVLLVAAFPKWSNRRIGEACGVGHQLVAHVRPEQVDESSSSEREGADGKVRRLPAASTEPADPLDKPLAKLRALLALVPDSERARFAELVLACLSAPAD
jgi:hypothetical protein